VITVLRRAGIDAVAVATPLAGLQSDATYVASLARSVDGPVVLAGHDYGGAVITASAAANVVGLVYVAALAPAEGETSVGLLEPQALEALWPVVVSRGVEAILRRDRYRDLVAGDLPLEDALTAAATQRPVLANALGEAAPAPTWGRLPSWFVVARRDRLVAPERQRAMAVRAGGEVVELDASHNVPRSKPDDVAEVIARAAG